MFLDNLSGDYANLEKLINAALINDCIFMQITAKHSNDETDYFL